MKQADNKRIAKNAVYLYGRMLLTIGVSLYTNRVVLDTLGISNYGIYNLVGGIVAIFGFLNATMSGATARFLNYEMGRDNTTRLRLTFSTALLIHAGIALVVLLLGETVGLWFVNNRLDIAADRMHAANITYQLSILAAMVNIVQIPFSASIMAHERMNAYAVIAIVNVLLKLAVTLMLLWVMHFDRLVVYALLMLGATVAVAAMYVIYCRRNFSETTLVPRSDGSILRSMLTFSGWDVYGNLCYIGRMQGTIVVLNHFGGTLLNAAGNLTLTVCSTITSFAGNVVAAFRPQIIQQYARNNYQDMLRLLNACARYSLLLMGLLVVPAYLEMDTLLHVWLKEVPQHTTVFCRIGLLAACGELLVSVVAIGIHATGRIKLISFLSGTLYILELPAMWVLLKVYGNVNLVYITHCTFITMILLTDTLILRYQLSAFSVGRFWRRGVIEPGMLVLVAGLGTYALQLLGDATFLRVILTAMASTALLLSLTYTVAIDADMRRKVNAKIASKLRAHHG